MLCWDDKCGSCMTPADGSCCVVGSLCYAVRRDCRSRNVLSSAGGAERQIHAGQRGCRHMDLQSLQALTGFDLLRIRFVSGSTPRQESHRLDSRGTRRLWRRNRPLRLAAQARPRWSRRWRGASRPMAAASLTTGEGCGQSRPRTAARRVTPAALRLRSRRLANAHSSVPSTASRPQHRKCIGTGQRRC